MALALVIKGADFSENKLDTVELENRIPCTAISLDQQTKSLTSLTSFTLTATKTPADTTDSVSWASSDADVATVSGGVVTAVGVGEATITATCGSCSATCALSVTVIPDYVVVGGFNARSGGGGVYNENVIHSSTEGKYAIVVADDSDTNLKTWDRSGGGQYDGDFRFVPIMIPAGAKRIKLESKWYSGSTLLGFKSRFLFCDSTQSPTGYVGVTCVDGKGYDQWDQNDYVTEYTATIPQNISGLDSYGVCLYMSDYATVWNADQSDKIEITYLNTDA